MKYLEKTCGDCEFFTGEECNYGSNEGNEKYFDSPACGDFEEIEQESK